MGFKDTLLVLTNYPNPIPVASISQAVTLGRLLDTRMSAISFDIDVKVPGGSNFLADKLLDLPNLIAAEKKKAAASASTLLDAFEAAAKQSGIFHERITARSVTPLIPDVITGHARLRDLTIIPLRVGDTIEHWYAESVMFGSGRPCLVLPDPARYSREPALDTVAIAWDFSRPAARAVADALPILRKARTVRALTVAHEKPIRTTCPKERLADHLAMHGVQATIDTVEANGRDIGDIFTDYVRSQNADLLVMGAFGHSRVRDFVLGGATRSMLRQPALPLFLSH